jgi:hypothetical protein
MCVAVPICGEGGPGEESGASGQDGDAQEYERAVIFRLGRLLSGGARGPGVFFVIPCLDVYQKIDMRTATYDVPPQEV